ncbi:hypothetical protein AB0M50_03505 [Nonomuraea fuscirosea]|uniref:hypothetical protein n=1 Tax=Nonomuraea fuscirosea TaxID=1291556 RepID=UPI002DDBAD01|nr:hypothetical protein [Nonomuraea fuscirosea]WSA54886.1 hypothetical protein OIE67_09830 [Nonomuraea fuscirosea]
MVDQRDADHGGGVSDGAKRRIERQGCDKCDTQEGDAMGRPTSGFTHAEYTRLVDEEKYPDTPLVPLDEPFVNSSGRILNVLLKRFTSAAWIESNAGSLRANHYHKTDWHYSFVASGTVVYGWRPSGSTALPEVSEFHAGQLFFTPPLVEHVMYFPVPTTFMTFARNLRDHVSHESDVVRVDPLFSVVWSETAGTFTYKINGPDRRSSPAGGPLS